MQSYVMCYLGLVPETLSFLNVLFPLGRARLKILMDLFIRWRLRGSRSKEEVAYTDSKQNGDSQSSIERHEKQHDDVTQEHMQHL